jgi:hypothetical protein
MTDFSTAAWTMVIVAWVVIAGGMYWLFDLLSKDRLMRCPEMGSVTLVGAEYASQRAGDTPELTVQRCGLWPEKAGCARGCLARYPETSPGYRVNLHALRPFQRQ